MSEFTLGDLKRQARTSPSIAIMLKVFFLSDASNVYDSFVEVVEEAIDYAASILERNPELYGKMDEDQITISIVGQLKTLTLNASHDTKVGGHVDILVELNPQIFWIGEAKIDKSMSWVYKGYQQILTRYSTGKYNQKVGGLLIYSKRPRLDDSLEKWKQWLIKKETTITCTNLMHDCSFNSTDTHPRTGAEYRVWHKPLSLHFSPKDNVKTS